MSDQNSGLASDAEMAALIHAIGAASGDGLGDVDQLLALYGGDARLHFLRGSILAGSGRPIEAHRALATAVELAPDFAIARFQLGFFELTSGEVDAAQATWAPLSELPGDHYLRRFVTGLTALIEDRFADCIAALRGGMQVNAENVALNNDMQLIVEQCVEHLRDRGETTEAADPERSATSLLLDRFGPTGRSR